MSGRVKGTERHEGRRLRMKRGGKRFGLNETGTVQSPSVPTVYLRLRSPQYCIKRKREEGYKV